MPTRIRLFGDTQRADQYRYIAYRKVLGDALRLRSFQNLPIFRHQARIEGGGIINVVCHHNFNEIAIYMPPREAPERAEEAVPAGVALLLLIGDEFVGYHGVVWDAFNNQQASPVFTASKLEDIYNEYPPAKDQDDSFIQATQVGLKEGDFFPDSYDGNPRWWEERIFDEIDRTIDYSDSKARTYQHPMEGELENTAHIEQQYIDYTSADSDVVTDGAKIQEDGSIELKGKFVYWRCTNSTKAEVWFEWTEWSPFQDVILNSTTEKQTIYKDDDEYTFSKTVWPTKELVAFRVVYSCEQDDEKASPSRSSIRYIHRGYRDFDGPRQYMEGLFFTYDIGEHTIRYADLLLSHNKDTFSEKLHSFMLTINVPSMLGKNHYDVPDEDRAEVKTTAIKTLYDYWQSYDNDNYHSASEERYHSWRTPVGPLRQKRRVAQYDLKSREGLDEDTIEDKPWELFYHDDLDMSKYYDEGEKYLYTYYRGFPRNKDHLYQEDPNPTVVFFPDIESKDTKNFPDGANYNTLANKTIDARHSERGLGFQIYTVSFPEWVGAVDPDIASSDDPQFKELCRYDHIFVVASCGSIRDPRDQERSSEFEEALASLIDIVTQDQRENSDIPEVNEHTSYRGYLHAYFIDRGITNIFEQPRSRDAERLKLLNLVNQARKDNGLEPVKYSWDLEKAAIRFTFDMVDDLHIGHTGQDGSDASQRQVESGFFINADIITSEMQNNNNEPMSGWENTGRIEDDKSAEAIFDAWMNSDEHRANILDSRLDKNGAMGADYRLGSDGFYYWAQEFARNPNY